LFVAVAASDRLAAVDPRGNVRWAVARPGVSDPSWFPPTGYRVAYLSSDTLRVIAGDGTGDHLLATRVARVAPAWRPYHAYQLAYVTGRGRLVVRDADTGLVLWSVVTHERPRELMWSSDGARLVVLSATAARTYAGNGAPRTTMTLSHSAPATDGALSPDGRKLALILGGDEVVVTNSAAAKPSTRQLLAGSGLRELSWSPNGRWLIVAWPAADQWVFLRVGGTPRVAAVARIAQQFSDRPSASAFPRLEGWCCTARGPAG
jgi:Tol biopolymer transport system component